MKYKFKQGDVVAYDLRDTYMIGVGKVVGISAGPIVILGPTYIIEDISGKLPTPDYEYTHFAAFERDLTFADKQMKKDDL